MVLDDQARKGFPNAIPCSGEKRASLAYLAYVIVHSSTLTKHIKRSLKIPPFAGRPPIVSLPVSLWP